MLVRVHCYSSVNDCRQLLTRAHHNLIRLNEGIYRITYSESGVWHITRVSKCLKIVSETHKKIFHFLSKLHVSHSKSASASGG
jgi:hypothetical protein